MFVLLFVASFVLSLGISAVVAWGSKEPIESILYHFFPVNASLALSKYLRLAIVLIGVSSGSRIHLLEEYLAASPANKIEMASLLTQEFWVLEFYRTAVGAIEGILWLLLLFSFCVFVIYFVMRKAKLRDESKRSVPSDSSAAD